MTETGPERTEPTDEGQPASSLGSESPWAQPGVVTLRCRANGPLVVELPGGDAAGGPLFRVIDHEGREFPLPAGKRAVALCRCGQSGQRPFCDGSHRDSGFRAAEPAPQDGTTPEKQAAAGATGPVVAQPRGDRGSG